MLYWFVLWSVWCLDYIDNKLLVVVGCRWSTRIGLRTQTRRSSAQFPVSTTISDKIIFDEIPRKTLKYSVHSEDAVTMFVINNGMYCAQSVDRLKYCFFAYLCRWSTRIGLRTQTRRSSAQFPVSTTISDKIIFDEIPRKTLKYSVHSEDAVTMFVINNGMYCAQSVDRLKYCIAFVPISTNMIFSLTVVLTLDWKLVLRVYRRPIPVDHLQITITTTRNVLSM